MMFILWVYTILVMIGAIFGRCSKEFQNQVLKPLGYQWYFVSDERHGNLFEPHIMRIKDYELAKLKEAL